MRVAPRHHRAAHEDDPHQAVACDLLGPGEAVVEHVACEELQEDDEGERPEYGEHQPVFGMMFDDNLFVARDDEMDVFVCFDFSAHLPPPLRPHPEERGKPRVSKDGPDSWPWFETRRFRDAPHHEVLYFIAC